MKSFAPEFLQEQDDPTINPPRPRLLYAVTAPATALNFLRGQLQYAADAGFEVHLMCPDNDIGAVATMAASERAYFHRVDMQRTPSLIRDLGSLKRVYTVTQRIRPEVVIAGTPKMSLASLFSTRVIRTPVRVYLCHGLRFEGLSGPSRLIGRWLERFLGACATHVVAVSPSVAFGLRAAGVAPRKIVVLGAGSANGIDTQRFTPTNRSSRLRRATATGLCPNERTIIFIGRLTRDKGSADLLRIADALRTLMPDVCLLIVGAPEPADEADGQVISSLLDRPNVMHIEHLDEVELALAAAEILILPTKREGMPTVILEAAATGTPAIAYRATGTIDAIIDGETGLLTQPDPDALVQAIQYLLSSPSVRKRMGQHGRSRVIDSFEQQTVWAQWMTFLRCISSTTSVDGPRDTKNTLAK